MDLKALKDLVNRRVVNDLDHRNLNLDVPWLDGIIPSTENLAVSIWERIAPHIPPPAEAGQGGPVGDAAALGGVSR